MFTVKLSQWPGLPLVDDQLFGGYPRDVISGSVSIRPLSPMLGLIPGFRLLASEVFSGTLFGYPREISRAALSVVFRF